MAEKLVYKIDINGSKSAKTLGQLNSELEQMREELDSIPIGSQEFKKMAREISKTQSEVKNLEASFEGMDMEQKLTAATDMAAGLAGGFAAVEGAMLLVGAESEEFEEAMSKAMGAMAFATGIRDIGVMIVQMNKLGVVTKIQTAIQTAFNFVLSANPIGLIVLAIAALIAGIIALAKPIQNAIAKFESLNGIAKVLIGILAGPLLAAIYGVTKALEFFGVINSKTQNDAISAAEKRRRAEVKAHKERIKELNKEIDALDDQIAQIRKVGQAVELRYNREIELARAAGKETTKLEEGKLDETIETARKEIIALEERYRKEQDILRERTELAKKEANFVSDTFLQAQKQIVAGRRNEVAEAKNMLDELLHDRKVHNAEVAKEQRDAEEDRQKEARDRYRDHLQKMREIEMFLEDLRAENISDEYERELEQERLRYERIREEYKGHAEVLEQLEIEHQANLLRIEKTETQRRIEQIEQLEKEAAQRREERLKEEERRAAENRKMVVTEYNNEYQSEEERRAERDRKTRQLRVQQFNEEFEKRIAIVDQYFSSFSQLNNAFNQLQDNLRNKDEKASLQQQKNRFNREKAFNIASTAIETSKAIMGAVAASPVTFGLPFSAFAAATGAVQIAAIAAQKFNPSGGGGSVSVPAPSFSGTTSQPSTPDAEGIDPETLLPGSGGGGQMSQRVYVTEGDITRTQNRVNQIAQIRET